MPKEYTPEDLVAIWEEFLGGEERRHQVSAIADLYPDVRSLYVDFLDIEKFDPDLANYTLSQPDACRSAGRGSHEAHGLARAHEPVHPFQDQGPAPGFADRDTGS